MPRFGGRRELPKRPKRKVGGDISTHTLYMSGARAQGLKPRNLGQALAMTGKTPRQAEDIFYRHLLEQGFSEAEAREKAAKSIMRGPYATAWAKRTFHPDKK